MAKGTTIQTKCPSCGRIAHEKARYKLGKDMFLDLTCGHTIITEALDPDEQKWQEQLDKWKEKGLTPYPFQVEGVKFLEEADCNGLLLDEQGLGKTIQASMLLARNPQLFPALIVVKSGLRAQWFAEIFKWTGHIAQVITSSREKPEFGIFDVVIVSIDTLRLLRPDVKVVSEWDIAVAEVQGKKVSNKPVLWTDEICANFKFVVIDESQKIKNPGSARTQALRKVVAASQLVKGQKARVLPMSGTNIEKHAGEFFVTLNLAKPEIFYNQSAFQVQHCEVTDTGKIGGLKNPALFRELTKDFIIRRKREDVLPDLPKIFRQFRLAELEGGELQAYIKVVKEFMQAASDPEAPMLPQDLLGYMSKMRHITGIAKVKPAVEFIEEFMLETELSRKLAVFLHHQQAGAILLAQVEKLCKEGGYAMPLYYHAGLDPQKERPLLVEEFKKPENKIMLLSTQAAAEGLNLQFCSDCLIMERQWNPSTEEQAEGRFARIGSTADKINAHYLIAAGTIDDFLTDIVEQKRRNVRQTLDGEDIPWDTTSLISELGQALMTKGLKKWKLS